METNVLFFRGPSETSPPRTLPDGYSYTFWKPTLLSLKPSCLAFHPKFVVWWLFHHLRFFSTKGYRILLISKSQETAHYSFIFPRWSRFPFMSPEDLQVGDVYTSEPHRGRGLARFALRKIVEIYGSNTENLWYLTTSDNLSSVKVAENTGFTLHGKGIRRKRLGLNFLGAYQLSKTPLTK